MPLTSGLMGRLADLPDADLLARAQTGDGESFSEVVTRYERRLLPYLRRLLGDPEGAADALQETFVDLRRALARDGPPSVLPGWLYRAATNNALDAVRRRSFRARLRALVAAITPAARDPATEVVDRLAATRALAGLSAEDRACTLLSAQLGLTYREIVRVLGIGESAARQRITRAKARFRRLYEQEQ